jgi:hypothetical protein
LTDVFAAEDFMFDMAGSLFAAAVKMPVMMKLLPLMMIKLMMRQL